MIVYKRRDLGERERMDYCRVRTYCDYDCGLRAYNMPGRLAGVGSPSSHVTTLLPLHGVCTDNIRTDKRHDCQLYGDRSTIDFHECPLH